MRPTEQQRIAAARTASALYLTWLIYRSGYTRGRLDAYAEMAGQWLRGMRGAIGTSDT